jgi:hypothetical protein
MASKAFYVDQALQGAPEALEFSGSPANVFDPQSWSGAARTLYVGM